jgi:hypothetical protein
MPPSEPPALCRLCRRPLVAGAVKCPSCGARQSWRERAPQPRRRGWRIAAYLAVAAVLVAGLVVWRSVLHEIGAPISADEVVTGARARPSSAECAQLVAELTSRPKPEERIPADLRDRVRQCFERR